MIKILEPSPDKSLTTVEIFKDYFELDIEPESSLVTNCILAASGIIERYKQKVYPEQKYQEKVSGSGSNFVMLTHTPLVTVENVLSNNEPVLDWEVSNGEIGEIYRKGGWDWSPNILWGVSSFPDAYSEDLNFVFVYVAGYKTRLIDEEEPNLPQDVELCCIEITGNIYKKRKADRTIRAESFSTLSAHYAEDDIQYLLKTFLG